MGGLDTPRDWPEGGLQEAMINPDKWAKAVDLGPGRPLRSGPLKEAYEEAVVKVAAALDKEKADKAQPSSPPNVLSQAEALVYGDRAKAYGSADENHSSVARQFSAWLDTRYPDGTPGDLDAFDSLAFNVYQKLARLAHSLRTDVDNPHMDSIVDGAGYFGVMGKVVDERRVKKARSGDA